MPADTELSDLRARETALRTELADVHRQVDAALHARAYVLRSAWSQARFAIEGDVVWISNGPGKAWQRSGFSAAEQAEDIAAGRLVPLKEKPDVR